MRTTALRVPVILLFVALFGAAFVFPKATVYAQDEKIVCDSDLILSLYIAENFFGLETILEKLAAASPDVAADALDLSLFEQGQYERLFDVIDPANALIDEATIDALIESLATAPEDSMTALVDPPNAVLCVCC